jgi:hypothetical protein
MATFSSGTYRIRSNLKNDVYLNLDIADGDAASTSTVDKAQDVSISTIPGLAAYMPSVEDHGSGRQVQDHERPLLVES